MEVLRERFDEARARGDVIFYPSTEVQAQLHGLTYRIRICPALKKKEENDEVHKSKKCTGDLDFNPFLPYDPKVHVADLSECSDHVVLFNKFSLVPCHLLVITRHYERQVDRLTKANFAATLEAMGLFQDDPAVTWLAFYNSGLAAGASQHHRHFQLIPFSSTSVPIESSLPRTAGRGVIEAFSHFHHYFYRFSEEESCAHAFTGARFEQYEAAMRWMPASAEGYNILFTKLWLLIIPRITLRPSSLNAGVGPQMNALAFAGCLMVRSQEEYEAWLADAKANPLPFKHTTIPID